MEHFIFIVLAGFLATLIGAYVNNILTWRIKNRIEALDKIYITVLEWNDIFRYLCLENREHKFKIPTEAVCKYNKEAQSYLRNLYLYAHIVDGTRAGTLYQKLYKWNGILDTVLTAPTQHYKFIILDDQPPSSIVVEYNQLFGDVQYYILDTRIVLTSFNYQFNQIFVGIKNWLCQYLCRGYKSKNI